MKSHQSMVKKMKQLKQIWIDQDLKKYYVNLLLATVACLSNAKLVEKEGESIL